MDGIIFRSGNKVLGGVPDDEVSRIGDALQRVHLVLQQVIQEADNPIEDVYFLESGIISLIADTGDAGLVEVGMTGREGLIGTSALLNASPVAVHRAIVQLPGFALRVRASILRDTISQLPVLHDRCLRYVEFVMVQTSQAAACNARHELPARLARWLLMAHDRAEDDDLPMTQEFLSYMLGVRRAGVSVVANTLQAAGLIRQSRGRLTILDRPGLEAAACTCYRIIESSRRKIMRAD